MNWTTTPPSKPGAYWLNEFGHGRPGAPMLVTIAVGSMAVRHGGLIIALKPSDLEGEWCGPLVPAEEVGRAYYEGHIHAISSDPDMDPQEHSWPNSRARKIVEGEL